jgi:proteic killer suppression protein
MVIDYKTSWLEKVSTNDSFAKRKLGQRQADELRLRLDDFDAADNLEIIRPLKQARCHELSGDRKGQLSVDLNHPYRLIFEPLNNPTPKKADGGLDWTKVTEIRILEIVDYH